ncbi:putative ribonuclease H domain-containing protein [Arabidopsis thaliana]
MTNTERQRRHLCDTAICQVCKSGDETILHILRDCPAMMGIWNRIVPPILQRPFYTQTLLEWIYGNVGSQVVREGIPWGTVKCRDRTQFVKEISKDVYQAHCLANGGQIKRVRVERQIAWSRPDEGWFKLNTDGASRGNPGLATAGGVIRDAVGNWVQGFAFNIGVCTAPLAELWGFYYGLYYAWENKITRLKLEVDSKMVAGFLKTGICDTHPLSFLARLCYGFLSKDWLVQLSHGCIY